MTIAEVHLSRPTHLAALGLVHTTTSSTTLFVSCSVLASQKITSPPEGSTPSIRQIAPAHSSCLVTWTFHRLYVQVMDHCLIRAIQSYVSTKAYYSVRVAHPIGKLSSTDYAGTLRLVARSFVSRRMNSSHRHVLFRALRFAQLSTASGRRRSSVSSAQPEKNSSVAYVYSRLRKAPENPSSIH